MISTQLLEHNSNPEEQSFSTRMREARELHNLTEADLARQLRLPVHAIVAWERGEAYPSRTKLVRLADLLEVSTLWLQGEISVEIGSSNPEAFDVPHKISSPISQVLTTPAWDSVIFTLMDTYDLKNQDQLFVRLVQSEALRLGLYNHTTG